MHELKARVYRFVSFCRSKLANRKINKSAKRSNKLQKEKIKGETKQIFAYRHCPRIDSTESTESLLHEGKQASRVKWGDVICMDGLERCGEEYEVDDGLKKCTCQRKPLLRRVWRV
jgi:hypothetical protein